MWQKSYGTRVMKVLEPADLGLSAKAVQTGLPITGSYFEIGAFEKFQLHGVVVVTGGDRTAGTVKFTLEIYDSSEAGNTLLSTFDLLTGLQRFGAGLTKRASLGFGPTVAAVAQGDGAPAAGASAGLIRGIGVARLIINQDAAFSGGTTDPTTAILNAWLVCNQ